MELKQLRCFLAIAEEGNISAAARKLHMAQPPLSTMMKQLEQEMGTRLFLRGTRRIQLTDAGKILYRRAAAMMDLSEGIKRELSELGEGVRGTLQVGTASTSGAALLYPRMAAFHKAFPKVRYEIREGNTYQLIELLHEGAIEIAVVRTPFRANDLECLYLEPEPMVAAGKSIFFEGEEGDEITLASLAKKPLILYRRFEPLITSVFENNGYQPDILCKNDDARTSILWADAGLGVAVTPRSALLIMKEASVECRIIAEASFETRLAAVYKKGGYLSAAAREFLKVFQRDGEESGLLGQ